VLTPEMIKTGSWKTKKFRRYDVSAGVPKIYPGKKQAYIAFLDEVKQELISMGFKEMTGPLVESSFFNFDALYTPQDHPARGLQDVYYVKQPKYTKLGKYKKFLEKIKAVHENGGETGSTGWQTEFSKKETRKLVLRSHATPLSARTLANNPNIPGAYFSVARVYRAEKIDATHLSEFNQCEGIVLGKDVNFRHLLGLLAKFVKKLTGAEKVRFVPGYFPYTEPSVECLVWTKNGWIELLGAGIFRPELTKPLGINVPVLAWGIGIDRLFMVKEGITDIRQLFSSDLNWLREAKI
ncbi:phenylalanine--tRNA ligase subunit alpha, partial [Candidatus Woesearchaeota archaeon]|nr:phenylalanine--tRNA ligase subunit alpha [Candidatus Woesearchaeota archaeon]